MPDLEDAVDAVKGARIVLMNPPFTNRANMGQKFPPSVQQSLRSRADSMESFLVRSDPALEDFVNKNSIRPMFVGLADKALPPDGGTMTMVVPTIALSAPSGLGERLALAARFHVHSIVTCHQPGQINLSQNTNINESIVVLDRESGSKPPTRIINLDRFPLNDEEVADFHESLSQCEVGEDRQRLGRGVALAGGAHRRGRLDCRNLAIARIGKGGMCLRKP